MNPELNPYTPGSGRRPAALTGRDPEIAAFDTLVARTRMRRGDRGIVLTGLRGVGKTVLLNKMQEHAERMDWMTVRLEARRDSGGVESTRRALARGLVLAARRSRKQKLSKRMRAAFETITSFNVSVGATQVTLGVERAPGRADSGDAEVDMLELVEDVSLALTESGGALGLFVDEMQDLDDETLGALLAAQHLAGQREWPFFIIGAGLPNLPRVLTDSRSYAERLFNYRSIGQLDPESAAQALRQPAELLGARYSPEALEALLEASAGYPYFVQEYGQSIWNLAPEKVFTADDAAAALQEGVEHLDAGFYRARWQRATPTERRFLAAMAVDGDEPSSTAELGQRLGMKSSNLSPHRASLMDKGLIFAPQHGQVAYTVPGMAGYVRRHHHEFPESLENL